MSSLTDLFGELSSGLKMAAVHPNLLGYSPNVPQLSFHESRARLKLLIGGNRAGKSTGGLVEILWWCTKRHPYRPEINSYPFPIRARVVCKDFNNMVMVIHETMKEWVVPTDLVGNSWESAYAPQTRVLKFKNGSTIEFKSYDQAPLQHAGRSLHCIHMDEPPPKAIYTENLLRLLDTYSEFDGCGAMWMTYTPVLGMDWTYRELYKPAIAGESRTFVVHASVDDNPTIDDEAKAQLFANLSEAEIEIRRHGRYIAISGLIFKDFGPEHQIGPEELYSLWHGPKPPASWRIYWSLDHGINAPTAIYWHAVSELNQIITFQEYYERDKIIKDHVLAVKEFERYLGRKPDMRTGDPAIKQRSGITGTSVLQEYARLGITIGVESVPKDPGIGIVRMRQYMMPNPTDYGRPYWRIYNCPELVKELEDLHWEQFSSATLNDERNPKETVHKHNDHGFDSCKYFFTFMRDLAPELSRAVENDLRSPLERALAAPPTLRDPTSGMIWLTGPVNEPQTNWAISDYGLEEYD